MSDQTASSHEHCYHLLSPPYTINDAVTAVPEMCCWCAPIRLTIFAHPPADQTEHGPAFRFVPPEPEPPRLIVPTSGVLVPQ